MGLQAEPWGGNNNMKTIGQLADLLTDAVVIGNRDTVITLSLMYL